MRSKEKSMRTELVVFIIGLIIGYIAGLYLPIPGLG